MSYFTDYDNEFTVFEAPKNGGTTLRLWIYYAGTGELVKSAESEYYAGTGETYKQLQEWGYVNGEYENPKTQMVCIKRDPVDRFVSAFYDKVIKEGRIKVTIDEFLSNYKEILDKSTIKMNDGKTNFMKFHFESQTYHFGKDRDLYHKVFDISEVGTGLKKYLEGKWNIELPDVHARNSGGGRKFDLSRGQLNRVKEIYTQDYYNGWY